ncbi:MAG: hypothetical protein SFW36_05250 [Leptolyngbyaceae cyanobacterium bins.59]|nr:hypothetical protein [Leptolyngbyaceae cyanobacterium bins.59]
MPPEDPSLSSNIDLSSDSTFQAQVQRMQEVLVYFRWLTVLGLWLTIGTVSLWGLRSEIALWVDYFTWVAVRYALAYNPWQTLGLSLCIGMTAAVLVWQSRNILFGLPQEERKRLEQQVYQIRKQGPSHPLWKRVIGE